MEKMEEEMSQRKEGTDLKSRRNGMELTSRPEVNPARAEMNEDRDEATS